MNNPGQRGAGGGTEVPKLELGNQEWLELGNQEWLELGNQESGELGSQEQDG